MPAGALNQRITFQRRAEYSDGIGGIVSVWGNLASFPTVWASVKAKTGREGSENEQIEAAAIYVFTIYSRSDLSEKDRIVWGGRDYNIKAIFREGLQPQMIKIEAEQGVSDVSSATETGAPYPVEPGSPW